ncbi:SMC_N domain-containing protein [Cephalotus follicularis]|uniref:Structural maintenance of chromosomes protein 5 n=1 Tax=Cephalotus follicularis TaxID=3775 RepID=A0A1Q3C5A5_CEPFO|nr:SMC_N domain-containing protein [Cephalotus follicularis]
MGEPHPKRAKITRGQDDYLPGNIIEIELHNFMTFNHLTCKPGPRLNLVIGPNGSGKSSIVCAIALGLGGEPQLLGRATSVGAYVKRGEEAGYIKISLRGDTENEQITIMRKINTSNKSEWLFNGKAVAKRNVAEMIQKFNIQVNNLTQFLPQDRVCEFAKLTPVQLLEETEKAVGNPQLPIQHRALVGKSEELKQIKLAVEKNGDTLNQLKAQNAELEKDVERVRQRNDLLSKVESMKKKLPWLKYDMKKVGYVEAKEREKDAEKKLNEAAKVLNDFKEPIEKQRQKKTKLESKCKKVNSFINVNANRRREILDMEDLLAVQVQGKYKEMEDLRRQEETRQQKILKAKEDLSAAELELLNLPLYEPPKDETERLRMQILELEVSAKQRRIQKIEQENVLTQKKGILGQLGSRLKDMENKNNKLLQALRNSGAEKIFEAYHWLQQHRQELNKEVYGPVLIEVNVSDRVHADYLEDHVPYYIWKSFITQDSGDRDFLVKNLRIFDVPVLNYVRGDSRHNESFQISEEMRALGIHSRLDQVFDAPDAVKEVLISQCGLDHSYIGSRETDQKADEVAKLGILDFWTPENHYRWSRSRYGGHVSASVELVKRSRLILCSSDVGEIEKLRSRKEDLEESVAALEESLKLLKTEQRQLEDEAATLHKQREEIINISLTEKRKRREMENRISQRRKKLELMEKEDELDTVAAKLIDQATNLRNQRFDCAIEFKNLLVEAVAYKWSLAENHMAAIEFDAKIRELDVNLKQHQKFAEQASLQFEYCKKEVEDCRQQLLDAKRQAESIAVITTELEKAFLEMPTTIEELDAAIKDNISQANSFLFLNQNVLQEYEHRREKIDAVARKLEADKEGLKRCLAEIDALKENWLPALRNLVTQINQTFSRNFQEMAVAGEVSLDEHDMDFNQFGILIKVKFRQEGQLQVLSAHHQSGGERSVSTILYLVSLQDLTNCPFRVVDEINQGMDPMNERKMFQQLVKAASQINTPQCFLLTPKLLPDLEYSEACSILNIMNGPWIEQPSKVWSSGECWGMVTGLAGESRC